MTLSTKVAVLNNGYVQQLDTPERIYNDPANQFVAGFVGSPQMNLLTLPCKGRYVLLGDFKMPLPESLVTPPPQIVLGIRPEHVRVARLEDAQTIRGRVYLVENLGMHYLLSVQVQSSHSEPIAVRVLLPTDQQWSNDEVALALPPQNLHWFDVQTGDRLVRRQLD